MSSIRAWEMAEIVRSRTEAAQSSNQRIVVDGPNVRRYLNPPADTPYPLEYAFHLLGDATGQKVLDYGCGDGESAILLVRRNARIVGLDLSDDLLRLARTRLSVNGLGGETMLIAGSAHDIPLPDSSVDIVFGMAILHHLDLERAAAEVWRVLKPGGRAIFKEPVRDSRLLKAVRGLIPYKAADVSDYERPLTSQEIRRFGARFVLGRQRAFSLPFINVANVLPALRPSLMRLYRLDRTLLKYVPFLRHYAGVRVFELLKTESALSRAAVGSREAHPVSGSNAP